MASAPMKTAITGDEPLGDRREPLQALAEFYRAFNRRDLDMMAQNWDSSSEAAMDNPVGGIKRGWEEIRPVYQRIFDSPARVTVEFYDYTMHMAGDIFYVVGRERGLREIDGQKLDIAIRTTRIFRRSGGRWRQVHHHGSFDDPVMLAAYQSSLRQA